MKRLLLLLVLLLARVVWALPDPISRIAQANAAYENGDYTTAIQVYQSLVDEGVQDSAVYFNLGSAYYQAGDMGRSLVNLLRAQALTPRDGDLNLNLARIRSEREDIQGDETGIIEGMATLTNSILTFSELAWLTLLVWFGWFALLAAWVLRENWREGLRVPLLFGAAVVLVAVSFLASRWWVQAFRPAAVIIPQQISVMSGPGDNYLELYTLHSAAEVHLVETRGGWIRFALPDGRQGWIAEDNVERV